MNREDTRDTLYLAKMGDKVALGELMSFYGPQVERACHEFCSRNSNYSPVREDLIGEARLLIAEAVSEHDDEDGPFTYFLMRFIKNRLATIAGKYRPRREVIDSELVFAAEGESGTDSCDVLAGEWFREQMWEVVCSLPLKQRQAIVLYFYEGFNQRNAARLLGINQPSFSKRLKRALANMREVMSSRDDLGL